MRDRDRRMCRCENRSEWRYRWFRCQDSAIDIVYIKGVRNGE